MKILDALWFAQMGNPSQIGIVIGSDTVTGQIKCYIGQANGGNENQDRQYVAETGAKFPLKAARLLFPSVFKKSTAENECEVLICASYNKDKRFISVNEIIEEVCFNTTICQTCADVLEVKAGDNIPEKGYLKLKKYRKDNPDGKTQG